MTRKQLRRKKTDLAEALARDITAADWARANRVHPRTAQRWATETAVVKEAERARRRMLERTVRRKARTALSPVKTLAKSAANGWWGSAPSVAAPIRFPDKKTPNGLGDLERRLALVDEAVRSWVESSARSRSAARTPSD